MPPPVPAGPAPGPAPVALGAPPSPSLICAAAGTTAVVPASKKNHNVSPKCRRQRAPAARPLCGFGRALLIAPAVGGMVIVSIGAKMLGGQTVTLVEQKADPGAGAKRAERGFDFALLRVVRFDDEHDLSNQRRQRGGVAARHAG